MKLSVNLPWDILVTLTPSLASSRTSLSSKTPGRDLEDLWSLYKLPDVGSWWNFEKIFTEVLWVPWHHLHLNEEHPCPQRLQEETCRIDGVLTNFLMLDIDETVSKASLGYYEYFDTISNPNKKIHFPKTPGRDLENRWSLDKVPDHGSWWNFLWCFEYFHTISNSIKNIHVLWLQQETWRIGGVLTRFLMLYLDETFSKASLGYFEYSDTISSSIRNIPVLQDSRKRLGG